MYCFKDNSFFCGETALFKDITLWVNTKIHPWDKDHEDKISLCPESCEEGEMRFKSENGAAVFTLTFKEENNSFALYLKGEYNAAGTLGHGLHLNSLRGIGIDFALPHTGAYVGGYMYYLFWQLPQVASDLSALQTRTQTLLYKNDSERVYLNTVCDNMFKTELFPVDDNRISIVAHSNTLCDTIDECVLVGAVGEDEYALPDQAVGFGLKAMNKMGKLRKDKKYPEILEYLGWCSWDAFQHYVTPEKLLQKCQEFKDKDIPVRWMILDDTWNDVTCIDLETKGTRELNDWEAAPERFPEGLKKCVQDIKARYDLRVGIWHPTSGYWYGINPNGPLAKRIPQLLEYTIPGFWPDGPRLMHSFDKDKVEEYYDIQHKFYKDCGADFTKIDNQGSTQRFSYFKGGIGECNKNMMGAIEKIAEKYYDGTLINCMGMPNDNFWNRGASAVNRFSGDFLPEDRKWFIQHLLQCSYNSYSQGTVYVGDWDMFWTDDDQAKKNAVLRAMSGGPIYVSDKLGRSIRDIIMPLVYSDGRIIRLKQHPLPTQDCMFENAEENGKIYKIFNLHGECGVLAAFNLDKEERCVAGSVSPADVYGLKEGRYVLYDWFTGEATEMDFDGKKEITLENYDDFRLYMIAPVKNGKAVIGLKEKYMSLATFENARGGVRMLGEGNLLVYSNGKIEEIAVEKDQIISI